MGHELAGPAVVTQASSEIAYMACSTDSSAAGRALGASGLTEDQWMDSQAPTMQAVLGSGRHPTFARVLTTLSEDSYDLVLDNLFELGLRALLDGLAGQLDPPDAT